MWIDDDILERCAEPLATAVWVPAVPVVVLGSSNVAATEVDTARCAADGVQVLRRYGGGGTVLLHAGCVVLSVGTWVRQHFQNKLYFERLNAGVIAALAARWPALATLGQRGLSDLVAGDRKVAGTSLFRSRNYLLYQVSLLVEPETERVAAYLKHPSKEPDYRRGRSHAEFITGLARLAPEITSSLCADELACTVAGHLAAALGAERARPSPGQFPTLLARVARGRLASAAAGSQRDIAK